MEPGENFRECAKRELKEETGFEVDIREELMEFSKEFAGVERVFRAEITGGEKKSSWEGEPVFLEMKEAKKARWRWDRDIKELLSEADPE